MIVSVKNIFANIPKIGLFALLIFLTRDGGIFDFLNIKIGHFDFNG